MPLLIAALLAVAALVTPDTSAAVQPAAWHQEDAEPGARVADLDGRLRLQRASGEAFELGDGPRARQTEIREGDRLSTGWNSRLVIDIGPNRVKLDERSELLVRRLDRNAVALDLERGGVVLELRRDEGAWRWQVDSAAGRHQPHGAGLFRVDAPDRRGLDAGSATAWRSALRIENEDGTLLLPPGTGPSATAADAGRSVFHKPTPSPPGPWPLQRRTIGQTTGMTGARASGGRRRHGMSRPHRRRPRHV